MRMKRKNFATLAIALFFSILAGCGTTGGDNPDEVNAEGELKVSIEAGSNHQYKLIIENGTAKDETLTFGSSQNYDYYIKKPDGTIAYTYSADKSFLAVIKEVVIKAGERLEFDLDITEALQYLEAGEYTIEAWVSANELAEKKATIPFYYDRKGA
ncbi:BsuPI-related putative proteinase inhibitor [Robertmurraya kyonggiensis]|uniref:Intracellular proteinase inhibitor BsuPI domain-containing protein n=1 Tax=Robertmurraya kyonggiensis TaxID=1037680 RepID=A0A4U1DC58_9BACI|nr:BsuPI-related putative proteinase inhibitor [Robertmurraya kyonggiensis]TKC19828.1 hypothetical protein FA727_09920 [Robertmurraya kyonggiensis]